MRGELVALDLETTGLDPQHDRIIEVGAIRFKNGNILDEYSTLVNPGIPISSETAHITGIHTEDVANAPGIHAILPTIRDFIGKRPVVAHNAGFDLGFIRQHGILKENHPLDTFELASILKPQMPRYTLASLTNALNIQLDGAHRALADARGTVHLYWHLWQTAVQLPYPILYEITNAAKPFNWEPKLFFQAAVVEKQASEPDSSLNAAPPAFDRPRKNQQLLQQTKTRQSISSDEISAVFAENGLLSANIDQHESRPQQTQMAQIISGALNNSQHLIIEAGTGVGKSIAYLVPATLWATKNQTRVIIATNTINLQDQLINHDIPLIRKVLPEEFNACVMKGRGNYLCPRRLAALRRRRPGNIDELRTLAKILVWLDKTQTGDRGEITLRAGEVAVWQRLSAHDETCSLETCRSVMQGACPFYKARKTAESAHLIIANHALLISDATNENRVLPDYDYLIVDESHQFENAITSGLTVKIDQLRLQRKLLDLGGANSGLLGELLELLKNHVPAEIALKIENYIQNIAEVLPAMSLHIRSYFTALSQFLSDTDGRARHQQQIRITHKQRAMGNFAQVETVWEKLHDFFEVLEKVMSYFTRSLKRLEQYQIPNLNDYITSTAAYARYFAETHHHLRAFSVKPDPNEIYWIEVGDSREQRAIQIAPLHVGNMVEEFLWQEKNSVILTSATLRTQLSFQYIQNRLNAERVETIALGSPFNYKESTLVYIPQDIPEPNHAGYQQEIEKGIIELAATLNGRTLALFTSYSQLQTTARAITPRLNLGNITVLDQNTGSSRQALLENFKSLDKAVLLGTRSFWQGVDIPGESLSALVIVRLPFAVPSDPIFAARSETYANSFHEYAIPDAILRFLQGFGRLIRARSDRGIVAIFDSRILTKNYGRDFLESLPECALKIGPLKDLAQTARGWLETPEKSGEFVRHT